MFDILWLSSKHVMEVVNMNYDYGDSGTPLSDNARTFLTCLVWACEQEGLVLRLLEITDEQISYLEGLVTQSPYARWAMGLFRRSEHGRYQEFRNQLVELTNYSFLLNGVVGFNDCGHGGEFDHLPGALAKSEGLKEFFVSCARALTADSPKTPTQLPRRSWGERLLAAFFRD